jgi:hypothetical protein
MHTKSQKTVDMLTRASNRQGYALVLVLIFVVLFTAILGVAWRRVASALRIEHISEVRKQCDKGSIQVLAQAMKVLETRVSWDASNGVKLDGSAIAEETAKDFKKDLNGKWYKVTFTRTNAYNSLTRSVDWSVSATIASESDCSGLPDLPNPL